ncbi:GntR family transcriptional regulator [Streptomyces sp. NPDC047002]|uniref:GntR family transcriptional regulator n=1 Tax=Streptomyces sp. NPDC047002 TaxID=3155475 RepID=UPI003455238D
MTGRPQPSTVRALRLVEPVIRPAHGLGTDTGPQLRGASTTLTLTTPPVPPAGEKHMANRSTYIADDLRRRIAAGTWAIGDRLPAEQELAACYRVSTPTLRTALEVLQSEGLVEKRHGAGNFVRRPGERLTYETGAASDVQDGWAAPRTTTAASSSLNVSVATAVLPADPYLSALLAVEAGSDVLEHVFLSHRDSTPCALVRVYVPHALAAARLMTPENDESSPGNSPWGHDIRHRLATAGVAVTSTTNRIIARFPTADEGQRLHITTRTPVLAVERRSTDANGRVVEAALLVLPGDRVEVVSTTSSASGVGRGAPTDQDPRTAGSALGEVGGGDAAEDGRADGTEPSR